MIKNETVYVQMTTRGWGGWASVAGHRELLRLFSFTHPFWACLGGLQPYMPRRPET